jgi:hypothetical protein
VAEKAQCVRVGVHCPPDGDDEGAFGIGVPLQVLLDGAFPGSGNAQHETESSLLCVDAEGVYDFLLVRQQRDIVVGEGVLGDSVEGADHYSSSFLELRRRALAMRSRGLASPIRCPL